MNRPKTPGDRRAEHASGDAAGANAQFPQREIIYALLALAWLVAFLGFFYQFDLPNDPGDATRFDLWMILPDLLPPPPVSNGAPYGWRNLPERFDILIVAGTILAGAWGFGHLLLRLLRVPLEKPCAERTAFALGIGLAGLSLVALGCGLAGLLLRWLFGGLIFAAIGAECFLRLRDRNRLAVESAPAKGRATPPESPPPVTEGSGLKWLCLAAMTPFVLVMLLGSMLPTPDFDSRAYHLVGPKEYLEAGRISFLEHNVYTSFPFLTEMLTLIAMVLRGDWYRGALAGQLVLACIAPLTAVALYAAGRRALSPSAGWIAATVFLTTPWVYRISIIPYAEGGLAFYLFASVLGVMAGADALRSKSGSSTVNDSNTGSAYRFFLVTGLLAGSGMACKYTGLVQVVAPIGIAVVLLPFFLRPSLTNRSQVAVGAGAAFAIGVAVAIGPWLLKNVVETGNPVYPLGYTVFDGRDLDDALNVKWNRVHGPRAPTVAALWYDVIDVIARNDWLSPLLYGLGALSVFVALRRRLTSSLWLYAAYLFAAWWLLTHRIDRFWVPMLPVIALLAGIGACWSRLPHWRWGAGILAALAIWFNLGYVTTGKCGYNAYLSDLAAAQRSIENPGFAYLNRTLPAGSKVLVVGDGDVFDARVPIVYNTVFDRSIFELWTSESQPDQPEEQRTLRDAAAIRKKFAEEGITHVYVNWQWILTYRRPGNYGYTGFISPHRFVELQKMGVLGSPMLPVGNDPREWGVFFQEYDKLDPDDRRLIESNDPTPGNEGKRWGDELRKNISGLNALSIRQVFPVAQ